MTIEKLDETTEAVETVNDIATVGAILKTARENKGITIEAAALQLHLRPRIIEADIEAIKSCLNQQIPEHVPPTMQSFSRKTSREARDSRLNLVTYAIAFILLAMLVLWWVQKSDLITQSNFALPTVEEMQAETVTLDDNYANLLAPIERPNTADVEFVDPALSDANAATQPSQPSMGSQQAIVPVDVVNTEDVATNSNQVSASGLTNNSNDAVSPATSQIVASSQSEINNSDAAANGLSVVAMSLSADCWINLVDVNGKVLVDGVKTAGHEVNVSGKAPFKLILGAPQAVSLTLNGNKVDLSEYDNGRVARITLTQPN